MTNDKELRDLDAELAVKVMGWQDDVKRSGYYYEETLAGPPRAISCHEWQPTVDPAAAMEVLKKCAEKISPDEAVIEIAFSDGTWTVNHHFHYYIEGEAKTLETAIARFARKLFGQEDK